MLSEAFTVKRLYKGRQTKQPHVKCPSDTLTRSLLYELTEVIGQVNKITALIKLSKCMY